jgi:hypothetical protein
MTKRNLLSVSLFLSLLPFVRSLFFLYFNMSPLFLNEFYEYKSLLIKILCKLRDFDYGQIIIKLIIRLNCRHAVWLN